MEKHTKQILERITMILEVLKMMIKKVEKIKGYGDKYF